MKHDSQADMQVVAEELAFEKICASGGAICNNNNDFKTKQQRNGCALGKQIVYILFRTAESKPLAIDSQTECTASIHNRFRYIKSNK